LTFEALTFQ